MAAWAAQDDKVRTMLAMMRGAMVPIKVEGANDDLHKTLSEAITNQLQLEQMSPSWHRQQRAKRNSSSTGSSSKSGT